MGGWFPVYPHLKIWAMCIPSLRDGCSTGSLKFILTFKRSAKRSKNNSPGSAPGKRTSINKFSPVRASRKERNKKISSHSFRAPIYRRFLLTRGFAPGYSFATPSGSGLLIFPYLKIWATVIPSLRDILRNNRHSNSSRKGTRGY